MNAHGIVARCVDHLMVTGAVHAQDRSDLVYLVTPHAQVLVFHQFNAHRPLDENFEDVVRAYVENRAELFAVERRAADRQEILDKGQREAHDAIREMAQETKHGQRTNG